MGYPVSQEAEPPVLRLEREEQLQLREALPLVGTPSDEPAQPSVRRPVRQSARNPDRRQPHSAARERAAGCPERRHRRQRRRPLSCQTHSMALNGSSLTFAFFLEGISGLNSSLLGITRGCCSQASARE